MSSNPNSISALKDSASSPWSPFRHASFSVVWGATVISNIGGWMYSAASGWLMTDLNPDPFIVSMVQATTTLPIFLFALPAGALADSTSARRAKERGLDPAAFLADNDSTGFFEQMGDLLRPGPTFTNVNDFRAILVDSPMEPARNSTVG